MTDAPVAGRSTGAPAAGGSVDAPAGAVIVTEEVWGQAFTDLAEEVTVRRLPGLTPDPVALTDALTGARVLVVRNRTRVDATLLAGAPNLRLIARAGVGLDNIDIPAADARGIAVIAGLGANAVAVAELTVGLALAVLRTIPVHDAAVRAGGWARTPGRELTGRTWGLLGCGATGRATARLLRGFDCPVLGFDPFLPADDPRLTASGITLAPLPEVLAAAGVVSVHVPSGAQTRGLLNVDTLALMRPEAIVVNVARGDVIDEAALASALKAGVIAGAGLDVRAEEPPPPGPLDDAPGLVLTPHVAGITEESQQRIADLLVADIRRSRTGEPLTCAVGAVHSVAAG